MLLRAAWGVYPEIMPDGGKYARQTRRVMAELMEEFWNNAVHMMNCMYQNKPRGVMCSYTSNNTLVAYVDASNKPDPTDSKCQYR